MMSLSLLVALSLHAAPVPVIGLDHELVTATASTAASADSAFSGMKLGVLTLGAGLALTVTSLAAFSVGLEIERQLRAREVRGIAADEALVQRGAAAFIAWPAAVLSLAGVVGGAFVLALPEGVDAQVDAQVEAQVDTQVAAQVAAQVEAQVDTQVNARADVQRGDDSGAAALAGAGGRR